MRYHTCRVLYRIFPQGENGITIAAVHLILQPLRLLLVASETTSQFGFYCTFSHFS